MRSVAVRLLTFCVLLAGWLLVLPVRSGAADFQPISPEEMKINEVPGHPGAPAIVLYHDEKDDDTLHFHEVYMRIKVLTEAGREQADVQIPYNRRSGKITGIKGRTIHADGSIVEFQGKPFDKTIVKDRDHKYNVTAFTLPDVQVGSILEYRYTVRYDDESLWSPHWVLQGDLFQRNVHFRFKPYRQEWEDRHGVVNSGVVWTTQTPKGTKAEDKGEYIVYDAKDIEPFLEEPHMLPSNIRKYRIDFYYSSNRKLNEYWIDEGKYWTKDIDHFLDDESALRDELAKIVTPSDTVEQKVRKIYAHVGTYTNLSYTPNRSVEQLIAIGLTPNYKVGKVIRAKTGDREDLARLFVGLARQAGIPAYMMRVTARDESYFIPTVLDWSQLDNEIAIVQVGDKEVFLDPGTRFCPYGIMHWSLSATRGVRQNAAGKGTSFANAPAAYYKDAQTRRLAKLTLNADGSVEGTLVVLWSGQSALVHRLRGVNTDGEGRIKLLEDEAKEWFSSTADVKLTNSPTWEESEKPLMAEFKISLPIVTAAGRRRLLPMHIFDFNQPAALTHATRTSPVYFDYPYNSADEVRVELPENVVPESLPAKDEAKLSYAYYAAQYSQQGKEVIASRVLGIADNVFPVPEYASLKEFFEKVKAADDQQVVLTGVGNAQGK